MRIHIRPGVLDFTDCLENRRYGFVYIPDGLYQFIIRHMFFTKLHLRGETRVSFTENRVTIPGHHFPFAQGFLNIFGNLFFGGQIGIQFFLHFKHPLDHFLVGESV